MKNLKYNYLKTAFVLGLVFMTTMSCERELSDEYTFATFPNTPYIFDDAPVSLTDAFFISFDPVQGANTNGFNTDENESYSGTTSIRIDVPTPNDPDGGFIGGIFKDRGDGRDLTEYDALTFWAKGSTTATVGLFGFGTDFIEDKYPVGLANTELSTDWKKYIIPIPDASKLVQEKGMFIFSAGTESTNGVGYTFWLDEIKFEKLGNIGQPRPAILDGQDQTTQATINGTIPLGGLSQTFNLGSGADVTVSVAPSYFDFVSSNPFVASVNELGIVSVDGSGTNGENTSLITATLNGVAASGSLEVESLGEFLFAPTPTLPASSVISIFSDAYTNVPVDFYNGFWEPFQTTESADFAVNGDNILNYTNFNFVGTSFSNPTVDASAMSNMHLDIFIPGAIDAGAQLQITLRDLGADGADGGGDDTDQIITLSNADFVSGDWASIDIPLTIANKNKLGLIIYENLGTNLTNFYLDNLYFY
jgi:hypothetical protein